MKKSTSILAAVSIFFTHAHAHYSFGHFIVNNTYDPANIWKYVRQPSSSFIPASVADSEAPATTSWVPGKPGAPLGPLPNPGPIFETLRAEPQSNRHVETLNFRCGRDAWQPHNSTSTADVLAGDSVGFRPEEFWTWENYLTGAKIYYNTISHIGPGQAYLAKKPDGVELTQWDGDGDWFKIDYSGPKTNESWKLLGAKQYNVTIPRTTPPGEYLLRVEQLYPSTGNTSEFFINCAQINIIGPGGGKPTGFAKFPGTYKPDEPALSLAEGEEITNGSDAAAIRWKHGFLSYVPPGPTVWTG